MSVEAPVKSATNILLIDSTPSMDQVQFITDVEKNKPLIPPLFPEIPLTSELDVDPESEGIGIHEAWHVAAAFGVGAESYYVSTIPGDGYAGITYSSGTLDQMQVIAGATAHQPGNYSDMEKTEIIGRMLGRPANAAQHAGEAIVQQQYGEEVIKIMGRIFAYKGEITGVGEIKKVISRARWEADMKFYGNTHADRVYQEFAEAKANGSEKVLKITIEYFENGLRRVNAPLHDRYYQEEFKDQSLSDTELLEQVREYLKDEMEKKNSSKPR